MLTAKADLGNAAAGRAPPLAAPRRPRATGSALPGPPGDRFGDNHRKVRKRVMQVAGARPRSGQTRDAGRAQNGPAAGDQKMTAIGPAGLTILAFVGAVSALAATHSIEQIIRRALGVGARR